MLKLRQDHQIKTSPFCGEIHEILTNKDNPKIDIAMVFDIKPTTAHFHENFEEIYFVIDGTVTVAFYDPAVKEISHAVLGANELIVFAPGVHHRVISVSEKNRLCVISLPGFDPNDEHLSDKI